MLLSVVGTKTATPCHQIQSRQVNLGRVICRSIHSTTSDLAKPSSRRRDLRRTYRFRLVPNPLYLLCGRSGLAPAEPGRVHPHAMQHNAQLASKGHFGALHAPTSRNLECPVLQA